MNQSFAKIMVLISVIFMDLLAGMEFDLFVPSFPELQSQFALSPFWVEALLSVNFLGYCLSLFFVGALGDRFGRKPIILLGLITFIFGSMLCLWAASYPFLIIGRFLQGVGVAAPAILSFLIIASAFYYGTNCSNSNLVPLMFKLYAAGKREGIGAYTGWSSYTFGNSYSNCGILLCGIV